MALNLGYLGLGLGSQGVGNGVSLSVSSSIANGVLNMRLTSASGIDPLSTLRLSDLARATVDVLGDVTEPAVSPQLASDTAPGNLTGSNQQWSAGTGAFESGALYLVSYEIGAQSAFTSIYPGGTSPFPSQAANPLPTSPGIHHRLIEADDTQFGALLRSDGPGEVVSLSVKKAEWNYTIPGGSDGLELEFEITFGDQVRTGRTYVPVAGEIYVAPTGSDESGTGAMLAPFRTIGHASSQTAPGDTVFVRPGVYDPFEVQQSGTRDNPITYKMMSGEEHQAIIRGELDNHAAQGGSGSSLPEAFRDGVRIDSKDWIIVDGLTIEKVWRHGVFVVGTQGEQHGHHIIRNNVIRDVGRSGIYAGGNNSDTVIPSGETTNLRTVDVLIESNDITRTNLEIDVQGFGNVEAISAAASISSVVSRMNTIHDTRQYGIDYKAGINGSYTPVSGDVTFAYGGNLIEENMVTNTERHGIYVDAGQRFADDITIRNNVVSGCRHGIVLARENGAGSNAFLSLNNIDIYNNEIYNIDQIGIYCHRHPGDFDSGRITNIRIRFNTVYNAARETGFKDINIDGWPTEFSAATMSGNDFIGNLVYSDKTLDQAVDWSASGWTLEENLNVTDGISTGTDPDFADVAADPPDFSLDAGSPAQALVSGTRLVPPFVIDAASAQREDSSGVDAGAIARNVVPFGVTILPFVGNSTNTNSPSFSLDLSSANTGDRLLLVEAFGSQGTPTITVNGNDAGQIIVESTDSNTAFGEMARAYEYTITSADRIASTVAVSKPNSTPIHVLAAVLISGAERGAMDGDAMGGSPTALSMSAAVISSENRAVGIAVGRTDIFGGHSWSGLTEQQLADPVSGVAASAAIAIADDVSPGTLAVGFTPNAGAAGSSEAGAVLVVYEKAQ